MKVIPTVNMVTFLKETFKDKCVSKVFVLALCVSAVLVLYVASIPINDNAKSLVCEFANESS